MSKALYDSRAVRSAVLGRWDYVFRSLAPRLAAAQEHPGEHVPTPDPDRPGGKDGFRLFPNYDQWGSGYDNTRGFVRDGFAMLQWVNGWTFPQALQAVGELLGVEPRSGTASSGAVLPAAPSGPAVKPLPTKEALITRTQVFLARAKAIRRNWNRSLPYRSDDPRCVLMRDYLARRGLSEADFSGTELRFCPHEVYTDNGKTYQRLPAMVAAVRDRTGRLVTLHRTFLSTDGRKADVRQPKKVMQVAPGTTINGCAIRLQDPRKGILGVAEGVETALSAHAATGLPVWPCLSAGVLARFEPPAGVNLVFIFEDKDASGTGAEAGKELQRRLAEMGVRSMRLTPRDPIPEGAKGIDWNDVLLSRGPEAFPFRGAWEI